MFFGQFYENWMSLRERNIIIKVATSSCHIHGYNRNGHLYNYNRSSDVHNA